ncbi:hypothetical protein V8C40DRAFT_271792 [Trichoderma camerunense]
MPQRWSSQEDKILREMVSIYLAEPVVNWIAVSNKLPGRSNRDCRKRWLKIQDHWRKGAWDEDEDLRLRLAYEAYGPKWIAVAAEVGTRNPDQCQKHWQNVLNPDVQSANWTSSDVCIYYPFAEAKRRWFLKRIPELANGWSYSFFCGRYE